MMVGDGMRKGGGGWFEVVVEKMEVEGEGGAWGEAVRGG